MASSLPAARARSRRNLSRVRSRLGPILQAGATAVVAWYLAKLALGDRETGFTPIAALICLGAAVGRRRAQALELTGGVVLGVLIADLLVRLLGTGPPQVGMMVILAMSAAAFVGGGTLLMTEAGVSAIIIGSTEPSTLGLFPGRPIEGLIGGVVAMLSYAVVFPPKPVLHVSRSAHALFDGLGRTLEDLAAALADGDEECARRALETARRMDPEITALGEALVDARETARTAPTRRRSRGELDRQERIGWHLDFAVHNARVMARDVLGYVRTERRPAPDLSEALRELAATTWSVAALFDDPGAREDPSGTARAAAMCATEAMARHSDPRLIEIAARVRSTAVDLLRAGMAGRVDGRLAEAATEELLLPRGSGDRPGDPG